MCRVLIANIKNMGKCPCPRCHVLLTEVPDLGKAIDSERRQNVRKPIPRLFRMVKKARRSIFKGFKVSGTHVEGKLGGWSQVPTVVGYSLR